MKKRKRVKQAAKPKRERKKTPKKISRLQASAGEREDFLPPMPEWPRYFKAIKKPVTLRLDADVLAWYRKRGRGYQTRINRALRKSMMEERQAKERKTAGE